MASTGEVACLGDDLQEALLKAMLAAGFRLPQNLFCSAWAARKTNRNFCRPPGSWLGPDLRFMPLKELPDF